MGGSSSVLRVKTDRADYGRGETVTGTLYMQLAEETTCTGIEILFVGCEHVKYIKREQRHHTQRNSDGSSTTHVENVDTPHHRHEVFLSLVVDALSLSTGVTRTLQPGQYEFPFRISLPMDLPNEFALSSNTTFNGIISYSVRRRYKVKCRCQVSGLLKSDLRHKQSIAIRPFYTNPPHIMPPAGAGCYNGPSPDCYDKDSGAAVSMSNCPPSKEAEPILGGGGGSGGEMHYPALGALTTAAMSVVNMAARVYVCCCCSSGAISMKASSPTNHWIIGGTGILSLDMHNQSNHPFDQLKVRLLRVMSLNGEVHQQTLSINSHVISLGPGESVQGMQCQFNTSCVSPAPTAEGRIFKCSYFITAECKSPVWCERAEQLSFPVTVTPPQGMAYVTMVMNASVAMQGGAGAGVPSPSPAVMTYAMAEPIAPPPDWSPQLFPEVVVQGVPVHDGIALATPVPGLGGFH